MEAYKDSITAYGWFYPVVEFLGMLALAMLLAQLARDVFQPAWWLVLALLFELLRGACLPWPGLDPDGRLADRWRLKPFR